MLRLKEQRQIISGTVITKEEKEQTMMYLLRDVSFHTTSGVERAKKAILYAEDDQIMIGSRVRSLGPVQGFSSGRNEGNFDFARYYKSQEIVFSQYADQLTVTREPVLSIREWLYRIRSRMRTGIEAAAGEEDAGILCAMLLGDRSLMDEDMRRLYQRNGISHILVISGLHISLIGATVFGFLKRRLGLRYFLSPAISGVVVFLFVLMSGMSVSATRAMIMFFFYLGAQVSGRFYDTLTALLYSAVILLLCNPLAILQTGFQLSYGAVFSISILLPVVRDLLPVPDWIRRIPHGESFFQSAQLSLSVWLGLAPLSASMFYYISPYSVLLNLIVVPCATLLLADGLIGGLFGIFQPALSRILILPDHFILKMFSMQMHGVERLPAHQLLTGHIRIWELAVYYGVLVSCCVLLQKKHNSLRKKYPPGKWLEKKRRALVKRYRYLYLLPVVLLVVILVNPMQKTFRVNFLDVGQGDGICIETGDGSTVMIDGGSTSEDQVGKYRIQPFLQYHKIRRVDYWIVTHTDEDHVSGLLELLESGYPVSNLVLSEVSVENETEDEMMLRLRKAAKQNHTAIQTVSEGAVIRDEDIQMTCLYPESKENITDKNELSQVWLLEHDGWRFLFTGDLGEEGEELLLERDQLEDIDVLKVGHHGSNYSSSEKFLEELSPEYAVISVGENNRYHHPGKDALKRLNDTGARIETTMEDGQITFFEKDGEMFLKSFYDTM
ncbi:MAG: DNA internalization-related competence protein ComEC/Rec2 [Eubacterium sp.]|nr:DNA internalization-related competence protein ComEC/Rec2 [Eubacterium sp.]